MEITIIRHGETTDNKLGLYQGQTQGDLSGRGKEQAFEAQASLSDESFDVLFTSDLRRAVDTCAIIFAHSTATLVQDKRLRERHFGALQGTKIPEIPNYEGEFDGAESMADMFERVRCFIEEVRREYSGRRVAVVSHGITIKVMRSICSQVDVSQIETSANCAILRLEI